MHSNEYEYMENNLYFKYVEKYGIDNVRGDIFSRETLPPIDIYYIQKIMRNENNDCFACGGIISSINVPKNQTQDCMISIDL